MTPQELGKKTQPPSAPELKPLEVFLGDWMTEWHVPAEEVLHTFHGMDTYEWMSDGVSMEHYTYIRMHSRNYHCMEIIGPYDTASNTYPTHSCDSMGQEKSSQGRVDDTGVWVFAGDTQCVRFNLSQDGKSMTGYGERLGEDGHWHHWMDMRYMRAT